MLDFTGVNYLAVLVVTLVALVLGGFWYSKALFGEAWRDAVGKTKEELGSPVIAILLTLVVTFFAALVMAAFVQSLGVTTVLGGVVVGLLVGLGFIATAMASDYAYCRHPLSLFLIQSGYRVTYSVLMGAVLAVWR